MIRVVVFLVLTAAFARYVAVWLADHPAEVSITWLGYHAEPPIGILIAAIASAAVLLWWLLRLALRAPRRIALTIADRRTAAGQRAIAHGLMAIGAGDVGAARRFAARAGRLAPEQALLLMLQAQAAQLSGESDGAIAAFRAMAERSDTKLFGLHGLFIEAQRRNDLAAARQFAEAAAKASPSLAWAGQAALEFRCRDGDWPGALEALERNRRGGLVQGQAFRRQRAVLLTAQALSLRDVNARAATELAEEAARLCPGLAPAAALAGRLLAEAGDRRKAVRILEAGWRESPHPDIANAYADVVPGASARERLLRVRVLARLAQPHPESALALANAALEAHEFAEARASLAPLVAAPTRRVATLMARIEAAEHGDTGLAREWMARAVHAAHDPAWTADGVIAERWLPVSPVTGRLDAFEWRVPVAELTQRGPLIEQRAAEASILGGVAARAAGDTVTSKAAGYSAPAASLTAEPRPEPALNPKPALRPNGPMDEAPVHLPDDPGPAPEQASDPVPQASAGKTASRQSWLSRGSVR
jgi:HemY protein